MRDDLHQHKYLGWLRSRKPYHFSLGPTSKSYYHFCSLICLQMKQGHLYCYKTIFSIFFFFFFISPFIQFLPASARNNKDVLSMRKHVQNFRVSLLSAPQYQHAHNECQLYFCIPAVLSVSVCHFCNSKHTQCCRIKFSPYMTLMEFFRLLVEYFYVSRIKFLYSVSNDFKMWCLVGS